MRLDILSAHVSPRGKASAFLMVVALGVSGCANMGGIASQASLREATSFGFSAAPKAEVAMDEAWWKNFGDAQLNQLIAQALADSPSLKIVQARLARAQAGSDAAQTATQPQFSADLNATRQRYTANGIVPPPLAGSISESGNVLLAGSWELDFFGKNRAALNAALGNVRAAQADAQAARLLLASRVARSYFQLARLQDQLLVSQRLLAQRTQALHLVQDRVTAGLDTRLELRQSEAGLPEARLQIESLQEQITLASHALMALTGQPLATQTLSAPSLSAIKSIPLMRTVSADLLGQRADIAAARWRVEAATQDVGSARSQFYPNINLTAFAGFSSIGLDQLLNADSQQWGVGPALHLPVFEGSRLRANLRGKVADQDLAIESYNAAVIEAVREVADQLASQQSITRQQAEQGAALALAENAYELAVQRYEAGLSTYLNVLLSESTVLNQRRQSVDLAARALDTQVALLRALGGGYHTD